MVCEKCEKKLAKVIVPDKWKDGASNTNESGGRKINENKLLSKKNRFVYFPLSLSLSCLLIFNLNLPHINFFPSGF
ncbi:PDZ-binding protein, CRIPT [Dillenia turbinata]|uniref:Cysteine-rich PDZ-binding protein n=1 Tax=Dillenia turbinata TaxID=194707 RepID=A0AAN8UIA3_9MAGN